MRNNIFKKTAICLLMAAGVLSPQTLCAQNRLVDELGEPLPLASITDRYGNIIGLTDNDGNIPELKPGAFPVTFTYIGFEPLEVKNLSRREIAMKPSSYNLPEIQIMPGSHPLMHITAYMREHSTSMGSSDSVVILKESIVDFLIRVDKTKVKEWKKPRDLASKTYVRFTGKNGLDSVGSKVDDIYLWANKLNLFPSMKSKLNVPEKVVGKTGFAVDTVTTSKGTTLVWQRKDNVIRLNRDVLSAYANHTYSPKIMKVLGATTDFTEMTNNYVFNNTGTAVLHPSDLRQLSLSMKMKGRGKIWKWTFDSKGYIDVTDYVEVYVIDREYLTEAEAKDIRKNPPYVRPSDLKAPNGAAPLHPAIQSIIDRINAKQ